MEEQRVEKYISVLMDFLSVDTFVQANLVSARGQYMQRKTNTNALWGNEQITHAVSKASKWSKELFSFL